MEPRALPSGDGMSGFHGRPGEGMDHMMDGRGGGGKFSSWIGKLAGNGERRGSLGFSDSGLNLTSPLARIDDDNDSNDAQPPPGFKDGIFMDRRKSYGSEMMNTPGGDGDTFIMAYRRQTEYGVSDSNVITFHKQEEGLTMDFEPSKPSITESICVMEPIIEGRVLQKTEFSLEKAYTMDTPNPGGTNPLEYGGKIWNPEKNSEKMNDEIFLVDLEKTEDGKGVKLKPQARKFNLSGVLQSNWAQNWFFKNNGEDNDAAQDGMDDEDELENKKVLKKYPGQDSKEPRANKSISEEYSRVTGDLSRRGSNSLRENTPDPTDELTFIGKFKKAIKDHPKPLRNMNTWEPQSF